MATTGDPRSFDTRPLRLAVEHSPPLSIPLRFMFTAPAFGLAAAVAAVLAGADVWGQTADGRMVAVVHLITLGVVTMTMFGALFQLLPVVAGARLPGIRTLGSVAHAGLTLGTAALTAGLWQQAKVWVWTGGVLLAVTFGLWVVVALIALVASQRRRHPAVRGMGLALAGAIVVAATGLAMLADRLLGSGLVPYPLIGVHVGWGFVAWIGVLIASVAFQVLPLLGLARPHPAFVVRYLALALTIAMIVWTGLVVFGAGHGWPAFAMEAAMAFILIGFAVVTLSGLAVRRADPTIVFWLIGMVSLVAATGVWVGYRVQGSGEGEGTAVFVAGLVYLLGLALSVISGMLYKIVPFLIWIHVQFARGWPRPHVARSPIPNVQSVVPERAAWAQLALQATGVVMLVWAVVAPGWWLSPAAAVFGLGMLMLCVNLAWVLLRYLAARRALERATGAGGRRT